LERGAGLDGEINSVGAPSCTTHAMNLGYEVYSYYSKIAALLQVFFYMNMKYFNIGLYT